MQGITIALCDLFHAKVDCIAVTACTAFTHDKGMSRTVYRKIGREAWSGLEELSGKVDPGDVIVTPPFGFPVKHLFHVIGPEWDEGAGGAENLLYATASLCFKLARDRDCHSLAMPLISTGERRFPKGLAFRTILRALLDFFEQEPEYDLEVLIATRHPGIRSIGQKELEKLTGFKYRGIKS